VSLRTVLVLAVLFGGSAAVGVSSRRQLIPFAAMIAVGTMAAFVWVWFYGVS
jgi:hypothetical protein